MDPEDYLEHVNADEVEDSNTGAIVAVIIGAILLVSLTIFLLLKMN